MTLPCAAQWFRCPRHVSYAPAAVSGASRAHHPSAVSLATSAGSGLEAPRANSGSALERSRINSAERKFRGRATSPNPRNHPFQRPSPAGDALNRGRAQTYDALGASLGGSSLNRSRTNTFDGLNRSRTNTFDGGLAPQPQLQASLDFRQRTNTAPASGAFGYGAARPAPSPRVPSATIEMYNSPRSVSERGREYVSRMCVCWGGWAFDSHLQRSGCQTTRSVRRWNTVS